MGQLRNRCAPLHFVCNLCIVGGHVSDAWASADLSKSAVLSHLFKATNLDDKMMSEDCSAQSSNKISCLARLAFSNT